MLTINETIREISVNRDIEVLNDIKEFIMENKHNGNSEYPITEYVEFERVNVSTRGEEVNIEFRGVTYNDPFDMQEEPFKFSFALPSNYSKDKLRKRVWNKILSEGKLERKGFKKYDVDYTSWV